VVDEIYKEMHDNDRQDPSKALNDFAHVMAKNIPSDNQQLENEGEKGTIVTPPS